VDVDSEKWIDYAKRASGPMSWLYRLEGSRLRQFEQELAARSFVTVVSKPEAQLLHKFCPQASIRAIPNGVDVEYFRPQAENGKSCSPGSRKSDELACVFIGALDYPPNIDGVTWFCRQVWPKVRARFPDARFVLVGRQPSSSVQKLTQHPGVELVGEVSDVRPYLQDASVVVAPLQIARGIQNKVLEALAVGKPVIASRQAIEGLEVVAGEHLYQATTPDEWFSCISALFLDSAERRRLGAAGRSFVVNRHRWDRCLQPFEEILGLAPKKQFEPFDAVARPAVHGV
jgi:sugar transferase (PEP-CTERM/EpsH1 system associated)